MITNQDTRKNANNVRCRICIEKIVSTDIRSEISSKHEYNFHIVTQMELRKSKFLSNIICGSCDEMLEKFADFKELAIGRQQMLHDLILDAGIKDDDENVSNNVEEVIIKAEPVEVKECRVNIERLQPNHLKKLLPSRRNYNKILKQLNDLNAEPNEEDPVEIESEFDPFENTENAQVMLKEEVDNDESPPQSPGTVEFDDPAASPMTMESDDPLDMEDKLFQCDLCDFTSPDKDDLVSHLVSKHLPKAAYMCDSCHYRTDDRSEFRDHQKFGHIQIARSFKCPSCPHKFYDKNSLRQHLRGKHDTYSIRSLRVSCRYCDQTFSRQRTYHHHFIAMHSDKEPDVRCEKCPKLFHTQFIMRNHVRAAHRARNFACDFEGCDKTFKTIYHKDRHMVSHTNERNHKCEYCPATYGYDKNLRMHREITHLGYRYFCVYPGCKLECLTKRDVVLHLRKAHVTDQKMNDKLRKELKQQPPHIVKTIEQLRKERMERKRIENLEMESKCIEVVVLDEAEFIAVENTQNLGSERDMMVDKIESETCSPINFTKEDGPESECEPIMEIPTLTVEPMNNEPPKNEVTKHSSEQIHKSTINDADDDFIQPLISDNQPKTEKSSEKVESNSNDDQSTSNKTSETSILECKICHSKYYGADALDQHMKENHGNSKERKFICDFCNRVYRDLWVLREHIIVSHSSEGPTMLCEMCPKLCITPRQMRTHMKHVHAVIKVLCRFEGCQEMFNDSESMKEHWVNCHPKIKKPMKRFMQFECSKCKKLFDRRRYLTRHMPKCNPDAPPRQRVRTKKSAVDEIEKIPKFITKKKVPAICEMCDRTLSSALHLRRHIPICKFNDQEKPFFECPMCCRQLSRVDALERHMKTCKHKPLSSDCAQMNM